jgi:hypothetical protein
MAQHQQWIPLDDCVYAYIDEAELSQQKFFKLWHIAHRGMTECGLDFFYQIKSVKLPRKDNFTVDIPADYLNWSKVGVLNNRGEVIPLKYNDKLTLYAQQSPDRLQKTQDDTLLNYYSPSSSVFYNWWNGSGLVNLYGVPSGAPFVGSFKIDNHTGVILLDENFCYDYIILEYVASPQEGQEYYIPIQFKEAIISYLRWKDNISTNVKTHMANASIQMRRHEFYNDRRLARARYKPFSLIEAYEFNLEQQRKCIKA